MVVDCAPRAVGGARRVMSALNGGSAGDVAVMNGTTKKREKKKKSKEVRLLRGVACFALWHREVAVQSAATSLRVAAGRVAARRVASRFVAARSVGRVGRSSRSERAESSRGCGGRGGDRVRVRSA